MNPIQRGTPLHTFLFVLGPFPSGKPVWKCLIKPMVLVAALWIAITWWLFSLLRLLRVTGARSTGPFFTGYWYTWSWRYVAGLESKNDWWKTSEQIQLYEKSWWPKEKGEAWPPAFVLLVGVVALFWAFFSGLGAYEFYSYRWMDIVSLTVWSMNIALMTTTIVFVPPWRLLALAIVGPIASRKEVVCPKVLVEA